MVGSAAVAYSAHLAQIIRVRVMVLRCGGARESRTEDRMICTLRMIGCKRLDMCTVVLYEYKLPSDVPYGFIYLIHSFCTRVAVDAVWRTLRPFEEGCMLQ